MNDFSKRGVALAMLLTIAATGCGRGSTPTVVVPDAKTYNNDAEMEAYNRAAAEGSAERK